MNQEINASAIRDLHKNNILLWKKEGVSLVQHGFYQLVEENHSFNFQLWQTEDRARRDDKGFEYVYKAKRDIDHFNQQRNNRMEAMDEWLYTYLQPVLPSEAPVNSESPGMIIDRLSILALKSYHMALQTQRQDASALHRQTCSNKLAVIEEQLAQLALCLDELFATIKNKTRTFRVYHQFKMYNDPNLNAELYGSR